MRDLGVWLFLLWLGAALLVVAAAARIERRSARPVAVATVAAKCEPRIVIETKVIKVPVVEREIDHRTPASVTRELRRLRHQVWTDKQNLATAYLPR